MKTRILELLALLLLAEGIIGLVNEATGYFPTTVAVNYLEFLDGYQLYVHVVLGVVGGAVLLALSAQARRGESDAEGAVRQPAPAERSARSVAKAA
jgi:hypothetical protein